MRVVPGRQERLAGLFVVVGSAIVFAPAIWLLQRWSEAVTHDPADVWGARLTDRGRPPASGSSEKDSGA